MHYIYTLIESLLRGKRVTDKELQAYFFNGMKQINLSDLEKKKLIKELFIIVSQTKNIEIKIEVTELIVDYIINLKIFSQCPEIEVYSLFDGYITCFQEKNFYINTC